MAKIHPPEPAGGGGGPPAAHQASHQSGGSDALTGNLDAVARTTVRKNTGVDIGSRRRLNLVEGANISLTVTDDSGSEEVDITIAAAAGGSAHIIRDDGVNMTARSGLNFIDTAGITFAATDDAGGDETEIRASPVFGTTATTITVGNDARLSDARTPTSHQASHQSGGSDPLAGLVDANARIAVSKNSGATLSTRRRLNLIEGANITLTVADDSGSEEVDITIAASGGGGSVTWIEVDIDFGSLPLDWKVFTITDAGVSATSKVAVAPSGKAASGRVGNDYEWDPLVLSALPGTGSFTLTALAPLGGVVGNRKVMYQVAA